MPTPTQVNTEDIAELKTSIQRLVDAVHLLEVTVTQRFGQGEKQASENHAEAMRQIAVLSAEVRNVKGIGKWILGAVLTLLAGVGGAIWWASQIDYRVGQLEQPTKASAPK